MRSASILYSDSDIDWDISSTAGFGTRGMYALKDRLNAERTLSWLGGSQAESINMSSMCEVTGSSGRYAPLMQGVDTQYFRVEGQV